MQNGHFHLVRYVDRQVGEERQLISILPWQKLNENGKLAVQSQYFLHILELRSQKL